MRQLSPHVTSAPHRAATTTVTHSSTAVLPSVTSAVTTIAFSPAVHSTPAQTTTTVAHTNLSNVSSTAGSRCSASGRASSSARRPGVRRAPRSRRVAILRPEDLYEISSQIVDEVLQRNRQLTDMDVITCDGDEDDDDDVTVVGMDMSDSRSGDDVMLVDEPAVSSGQEAGTRKPTSQQAASGKTAGGNYSARTAAASRKKLLLIPPASRSLSHRHQRTCTGENVLADITVADAESRVADESDDVVYCDEDSNDAVPDSWNTAAAHNVTLERNPTNPVFPTNRVTSAAADDDDDVLICDTPAPNETRANLSSVRRHATQRDTAAGNKTSSHTTSQRRGGQVASAVVIATSASSATATSSSATLPSQDVSATDDVVLVDADNSDNSVVILD